MPNRPPIHAPHGSATRQTLSDRERGSPSARGYDRLWYRFRAAYLAANPLCVDCGPARLTPATELHHIQKLSARPELRLEPANLMALCRACHSVRTRRGE